MTSDEFGLSKTNIIELLVSEAESYLDVNEISKSLQPGSSAHGLPIQPLYLALKQTAFEVAGSYLPHLSKVQRNALLDIDLWIRDTLDLESFPFWIKAYAGSISEEMRVEFVKSNQFALFLKGNFHIRTFDVEDPSYPDHDNYFLTEDSQLLFEFDPDHDGGFIDDIKNLIRELYSDMGVEHAYSYLFKIVADSFLSFQELEYSEKSRRMKDLGFVSYMDALEVDTPFSSIEVMDNRLKKQEILTPEVTDEQSMQTVHASLISQYREFSSSINKELSTLDDSRRLAFLRYDFIRLLNSKVERDMALKVGAVALASSGKIVKLMLELGFDYIKTSQLAEEINVFLKYDFKDIYRVGNSLIKLKQKKLKTALSLNEFSAKDKEIFLGQYLSAIVDDSFDSPVKLTPSAVASRSKELKTYKDFKSWDELTSFVMDIVPFINSFYSQFETLKNEGLLLDAYYLNYEVAQIEFETIFISSFANYFIGNYSDEKRDIKKMGLTLKEYKVFVNKLLNEKGEVEETGVVSSAIDSFITLFGMDSISNLRSFIYIILKRQLEGYDYSNLPDSDFKHVGGPIIFS